MELDPVFVKALRLLHSRSKDSALQLRSLYEEALKAKMSGSKMSVGSCSSSPKKRDPLDKRGLRDSAAAEKRNFDKLKRDLSELVPSKRARMGSPGFSSKSHTPSPTPPGSRGDPSGGNSSCDDAIGDLEMNLDTLTCVICKSFNQENGNILMECHTCQNLFHQECHNPIVSNEDADDPRLIWHCSDCSKTIKRVSPPIKPSVGSRPSPSKNELSTSSSSLFKRMPESSKGNPSGGGKPSGIISLGSSFKSSSSSSSSSSTKSSSISRLSSKSQSGQSPSNTSSNSSSTTNNIMSADKRLQIMKKKAAARKK